jgi:hypothetical protein
MPTANQMGACFDAERAMQENGHNNGGSGHLPQRN